MIIGIDGNEANIVNRVGVNTYAYELIKNLWKLQDEWSGRHKVVIYLKDNPRPDMPEETANFKYKVIYGSGLWILTRLTPHLIFNSERPDIFFSPSHYVPFLVPLPKVCSIMDLGYLDFSGQFPKKVFWQLKWWTAISVLMSKAVIAISKRTAVDIVRHYPSVKGKIHVTYLAHDPDQFNANIPPADVRRIKDKYSIVDDYVLYLGTLKPSKNIEGLLTAFQAVISNFQFPISNKLKLVIAGKKGWLYESIYKKVEELNLKDKVIFTDFLQEEDKAGLIAGAKVFALPSHWEGFGLDALNAMACGTPVVVSNVGSLPEVVGEAGVMVDPGSVKSIADGLRKVLSADKTEYNSMVTMGLAQAKKFSWQTTARETLKIIEDAERQNR